MERLARGIVNHPKKIIACFLVITFIAVLLIPFVRINYNIADYLPSKAISTKGIKVMENEFEQAIPNLNVMVRDVSLLEALEIKERLSQVPGVGEILWLDDVLDLKKPIEMADEAVVEGFYKNRQALFSVVVEKGFEADVCEAFWEIIGEGAISGEAANLTDMQESAVSEVSLSVAILLPAIIVILLLSTTAWLEPLLFLITIGVSVLINMGTNIIFGEISFITNSISPILQLAVSMDYAIFLLNSFADFRTKEKDLKMAMVRAIMASMTTIAASALTTLFGFLALVFMNFRIGPDLGICLAKGIILSFISVIIFLPALALAGDRYLEKTRHRSLWPELTKVCKGLVRGFVPLVIVVILMIVPAFLGQRQTAFLYGNSSDDLDRKIGYSNWLINQEFGATNILAFLVPRGEMAKEYELAVRLKEHPLVENVVSYTQSVDPLIPVAFLGKEISEQFYSKDYARLLVYSDLPAEGDLTFQTVEELNALASEYYDHYYLVGQSATLWDMKNTVDVDNVRVNLLAIIAIFLVIAFSFRSFSLPFILLLTIEVAIWINLSFPYFSGTAISFIGYLVLSTIQLGATIDYAILLTDTYLKKRQIMLRREALLAALSSAVKSILVSASILSFAGFTLFLTSSNSIVQDIGLLLGRGTLISMLMVICFLPACLTWGDKLIAKTTQGVNFLNEEGFSVE